MEDQKYSYVVDLLAQKCGYRLQKQTFDYILMDAGIMFIDD